LILEFPIQETNKHIYPSSVIRPLLPLVLYSYADFRATMSLLLLLTLAILVYEETKISSDNVALFTWKQKCSSSLFFSIEWLRSLLFNRLNVGEIFCLLQLIFLCFISAAFEIAGKFGQQYKLNDKAPRPEIQKEYSSE